MKKQILFILLLFAHFEFFAQANCPIFPKAKKEKKHFRWKTKTYLTLPLQVLSSPESDPFDALLHSGLGIAQSLNKHILIEGNLGGARLFRENEGLGWQNLTAEWHFQEIKKGYAMGISVSRFDEVENLIIPLIQLSHSKSGKVFFRTFNIGILSSGGTTVFQAGFKIGLKIA